MKTKKTLGRVPESQANWSTLQKGFERKEEKGSDIIIWRLFYQLGLLCQLELLYQLGLTMKI
jgi:hypothetical protein